MTVSIPFAYSVAYRLIPSTYSTHIAIDPTRSHSFLYDCLNRVFCISLMPVLVARCIRDCVEYLGILMHIDIYLSSWLVVAYFESSLAASNEHAQFPFYR